MPLVECFYHEKVLDSVKCFFSLCLWKCSCGFCPLYCCGVCYTAFSTLNQPCIPGVYPIYSWYIILFLCCQTQFASVLLRILTPIFTLGKYWSIVFLDICVWFWYQGNTDHRVSWEMFLSILGKSLLRISVNSSLNIYQNTLVKPLDPGLFLMESFLFFFKNLFTCYKSIQPLSFNPQNSNFTWFNPTYFPFVFPV